LIQHGQPPRQGERTDLQELKVQLDSVNRPMEIADEVDGMFGVVARTHRFAESYFQYKDPRLLRMTGPLPMCMCESAHPVLERLDGWMTHMESVT
jgi:hypothetical protein